MAEPRVLLDCFLDVAPITHVRVMEVEGKLMILEKRLGYSFTSRSLDPVQWKNRNLLLEDPQDEIHGSIWKAGLYWDYKFQRSDGWQMSSSAACFEAKN